MDTQQNKCFRRHLHSRKWYLIGRIYVMYSEIFFSTLCPTAQIWSLGAAQCLHRRMWPRLLILSQACFWWSTPPLPLDGLDKHQHDPDCRLSRYRRWMGGWINRETMQTPHRPSCCDATVLTTIVPPWDPTNLKVTILGSNTSPLFMRSFI